MAKAFFSIRNQLDRAGVVLSGLCAVHCLASIILVSTLGLGSQVLLSPEIHRYGLALAILVGAITIGIGLRRHGQRAPLVIGSAGLALMAGGLVVPHGLPEAVLTVSGVALVALAHIRNLRAVS